jgi:hypothetical protein
MEGLHEGNTYDNTGYCKMNMLVAEEYDETIYRFDDLSIIYVSFEMFFCVKIVT